jgi:hypothetical protein
MKKHVLVPLSLLPTPWANYPSLLEYDLVQSLAVAESLFSCLYSLAMPEVEWMTEEAKCFGTGGSAMVGVVRGSAAGVMVAT